MPKQLLHQGRPVTLIPMKEPDGTQSESMRYQPGWLDKEMRPEGSVLTQEPSGYLMWSKQSDPEALGDPGSPGDTGYVVLGMEITVEQLERELRHYRMRTEGKPAPDQDSIPYDQPKIMFETDPFSWRDLNVAARAVTTARDAAFGKPE